MSDKKPTDSRRKLLKSIAAGSGAIVAGKSLPESWSKPVVNSLVLPVHAEMTTEDLPVDTRCSIPAGCIPIDEEENIFASFAGGFEGDYFEEGVELYADSECTRPRQFVLDQFVIARTSEDADAIFEENNVSSVGAVSKMDLAGPCQIWVRD